MMPQVVTVRVRTGSRRTVRLWIPLLPVLLLLSPLVVLLVLVLVIACVPARVNPLRAVWSGGRLLGSLSGTRIDIERGTRTVLVHLR